VSEKRDSDKKKEEKILSRYTYISILNSLGIVFYFYQTSKTVLHKKEISGFMLLC